jgi:hypothetical protein
VRVEVSPQAALLTRAGEEAAFTARAFDAAGREVPGAAVTWSSSHPAEVAVDGSGRTRALVETGAALLTAEVAGVRASPVTVLVAQPAPGALLLTDAQVAGSPVALPPAAAGGPPRFEVLLQGVEAPAVGQVLLATQGAPVAGRVERVAAEGGGRVRVVFAFAPLPQVFSRLSADLRVPLPETGYTSPAGGERPTRGAGTRGGARQGLDASGPGNIVEFELGPFECKAKGELFPVDAPLQLKLEQKLALDFAASVGEGELRHLRMVVQGNTTASLTGGLTLQLKSKVGAECDWTAYSVPVPITGPLAKFITPSVPLGVGFALEASVTAATWQWLVEGKATRQVEAGFDYTPEGLTLVGSQRGEQGITPRSVLTPEEGAKDGDVELGAHLYVFAGLQGTLLSGVEDFGLVKAVSGPRLELKWAPERLQAARPDFAGGTELMWQSKIGPDDELVDWMTWVAGYTPPLVNFEVKTDVPLARSPTGALAASLPRVGQGEPVALTVRYTPATTHFLGAYNVAEVSLYRVRTLADGSTGLEAVEALAPQRPEGEQSEFTWQWEPGPADVGEVQFVAFTRTALPFFTFEAAEDSRVRVVVDAACGSGAGAPACVESGAHTGPSGANALSDGGRLTGYVDAPVRTAVVWEPSLATTSPGALSQDPRATGAAMGISRSGAWVTGWAQSAEPALAGHLIDEAFVSHGGVMRPLGTRARWGLASTSVGRGVTDDGRVAGQVLQLTNGNQWAAYAFVYEDGVLKDLGNIGASTSLGTGTVSGFDAQGRVLGNRVVELMPGVHVSEPTVWTRGAGGAWTPRVLSAPFGLGAVLSGGNGRGPWVGSVMVSERRFVAARWSESGAYTTLGTLGGSSHLHGGNTRGDVVGYAYPTWESTQRRAILLRAGTSQVVDLNSLVHPASGWVLHTAQDINDAGEVVGQGTQHGVLRMFRLTLPPAPSATAATGATAQVVAVDAR